MFVPATYLIEIKGIKHSVFLGMCLTTLGLWCNYLKLLTIGGVFVGLGMPFIFFTVTKVSAMWFGPKGRNITTAFLILAYFIPQTIEEFMDEKTAEFDIELAIAASVLTPVMWFIATTPQFSPTMGEEEKFIAGPIPYFEQLKSIPKNPDYLKVALASAFLLLANYQFHRILEVVDTSINDNHSKALMVTYSKELYLVCTLSGLLTFGMALYSTLSIKFGFKLVLFQFALIMVLQTSSMLINDAVFYIVIYVYDGLFKGGMLVIFYEMTAELAYPIGESISLGFMLAVEFVGKFIFNIISAAVVYPMLEDKEKRRQEQEHIGF